MNEPTIIATGRKMMTVIETADQVAPTDTTVLITGESGTGKDLVAQRIHCRSRRNSAEFIEVNCGAIPATLVESILFGHEKGSFTGADTMQVGLFEAANKGTIFFDEIGSLPIDMQVKLLRVLQNREVRRVGGRRSMKVDVRVVAATNMDLRREAQMGHFRQDLYFRLAVVQVEMPPLRQRTDEIPALVEFFAQRFHEERDLPAKTFGQDAISAFQARWWIGNVRELENAVERLMVLSRTPVVTADDVRKHLERFEPVAVGETDLSLEAVKRAHVCRVLMETRGCKAQAARLLGVNLKTLYTMLHRYGIDIRSMDIDVPVAPEATKRR